MSQATRSCLRTAGRRFLRPVARYRSRCGRTRETWPTATGPALQRAAPLIWPVGYQGLESKPLQNLFTSDDLANPRVMQADYLADFSQ